MATALKYITDDSGQKTTVLVPVKTWQKLNDDYKKLNKKLSILTGIQKGLAEIKNASVSGKKLQTLSDFLSEDNS